jgi:magnesium-transporting ATPase (P-type)
MNHQPFEDWILDERTLTPEEHVELEEHLKVCENCMKLSKGLSATSRILQFSPIISPQPGFTQRWDVYFQHRKEEEQRQLALKIFGIVSAICLLINAILGANWININQSPLQIITALSVNLIGFISSVYAVWNSVVIFFNVVPTWIPVVFSIIVTVNVVVWTSIWLIAVWRTPNLQRSVR